MAQEDTARPIVANEKLELAITELRRIDDNLNHNYDQVKIKILTFLGAGLAVLSYLYVQGELFIPIEVYGRIFYFLGLALMVTSLVILFIASKPTTWYFPCEVRDLTNLQYADKNEFLLYIKEEYIQTFNCNIVSYERTQALLGISSYMLIIGAIILVVLKQFGGTTI